jgi:hypothetical protein
VREGRIVSGYEEQLFARAEVLDDTDELAQLIAAVLAGAQSAGMDPTAVASLATAARGLDPGADTSYDAGSREDRHPGSGYRSDAEFLEAVSEAEDDVGERLREAQRLQHTLATAVDTARTALQVARALPVKDKCDGCHGIRQAAIDDASRRIALCEATAEILDPLTRRLQAALGHLHQVPQDLGEVYELVYQFIRRGGKLPVLARWVEGREPPR